MPADDGKVQMSNVSQEIETTGWHRRALVPDAWNRSSRLAWAALVRLNPTATTQKLIKRKY